VQRLFEQTWELPPLSVRNTFNGLLWIVGLVAYLGFSGFLHAVLGRGRLELAATLLDIPCRRSSWGGAGGCSAPSGSAAKR
jgi:membrane protein